MDLKGRLFMGRYEAKSLLGEGGMGRVYLAYQNDLKRQVVIKVMHDHIATNPRFRERFESETLLMARFQHPYAVTLYDATLNDPQGPCIIMEYIRGMTLEKLLQQNKGRLTPARVGRLLYQLCEVLQAAHAQGIIHRDLKPANIMVVDPETPYEKIKVMDFGLAKLRDAPSLRKIVDAGGEFAVGTPAYMCPEQVRGEEMDHRGDLYSVGVMLYEMLTGRLPFIGTEAMDVLLMHATENPPSFTDVGAADWASGAVEDVVMSCLEKEPDLRPPNARELAARFETALVEGEVPLDESVNGVAEVEAEQGSGAKPEFDPNAIVQQLEAYMPETIAAYKLCGFVQDAGGDIIESVPGKIRVQLGKPGSAYTTKSGPLSWLLSRKTGMIEMELLMEQTDPMRKGMLSVTVLMRSLDGDQPSNPNFRTRCNQIMVDLRGYLMGQVARTND